MNDVTVSLSPIAYAILTFLVIGAITLVRKLYTKEYEDAAIIVVATLIGGLAGHYMVGVGGLLGLLVGLNASGLVTTAIKFGSPATAPAAEVLPVA